MRDERRTHVSLKNHSRNIPFRILILINCGIYCITNNIPCGAACAEVINLICSILPSIIVPAKERALSKQSYNNRLCSAFMKGSRLFKHDSVHKVRPVKKYAVMCENLNRTVKTYDFKPLNTSGVNWNNDCQLGLITRNQRLANLTNGVAAGVEVQPGYKILWKAISEDFDDEWPWLWNVQCF